MHLNYSWGILLFPNSKALIINLPASGCQIVTIESANLWAFSEKFQYFEESYQLIMFIGEVLFLNFPMLTYPNRYQKF